VHFSLALGAGVKYIVGMENNTMTNVYAMFHTPRRNQGQIVVVSYASADGYVIRRSLDQSPTGRTEYAISRCLARDEGDYSNAAPRNRQWREISEEEAFGMLAEAE
jgi:hypothetical protein